MNVKLSSTLPKDDKNGLTAVASELLTRYRSQEHTVAIVILKTSKITQDEDFQHIPEVKVVRIEPVTGDLETDALDLLQEATEQRVGRKPDTLNFAGPEDEFADVATEGPRELEAGIIDAEIVDDEEPDPSPVTPLAPTNLFSGDAA